MDSETTKKILGVSPSAAQEVVPKDSSILLLYLDNKDIYGVQQGLNLRELIAKFFDCSLPG